MIIFYYTFYKKDSINNQKKFNNYVEILKKLRINYRKDVVKVLNNSTRQHLI